MVRKRKENRRQEKIGKKTQQEEIQHVTGRDELKILRQLSVSRWNKDVELLIEEQVCGEKFSAKRNR